MSFKKVTIHSDGTGPGTVIVDEDGNRLEGVISASIYLEARQPNTVNLEIVMPATQVTAKVDVVTFNCPVCQEAVDHECHPNTLSGT